MIGLANAGGDTINAVKSAAEFGVVAGGQKLAGLLMFISDVHSLGLQTAQGLMLTESFYWDLNDDTRAWSKRFAAAMGGRMPTMVHAAVYSAVTHYLEAVRAAGSDGRPDGGGEDAGAAGRGRASCTARSVRADGRVMRPFYLFQVKTPAESHGPYDYYKLVREIAAADASRPLGEGGCALAQVSAGARNQAPPRAPAYEASAAAYAALVGDAAGQPPPGGRGRRREAAGAARAARQGAGARPDRPAGGPALPVPRAVAAGRLGALRQRGAGRRASSPASAWWRACRA